MRFSSQEVIGRIRGLPPPARIDSLRSYLAELRASSKRFNFFEAEGASGETVFYGPATRPGMPAMGMKRNVLVVGTEGRIHFMTLAGLKPIDLNRPKPWLRSIWLPGKPNCC